MTRQDLILREKVSEDTDGDQRNCDRINTELAINSQNNVTTLCQCQFMRQRDRHRQ